MCMCMCMYMYVHVHVHVCGVWCVWYGWESSLILYKHVYTHTQLGALLVVALVVSLPLFWCCCVSRKRRQISGIVFIIERKIDLFLPPLMSSVQWSV